jgi:hypothetical protein
LGPTLQNPEVLGGREAIEGELRVAVAEQSGAAERAVFLFELIDDYLQALRNAGAQEEVIQALRAARPKPLTREQVGKLVAGGVPSERAAAARRPATAI